MIELSAYQKYLLMASKGNPIKLAVLLNNDLHNDHPDAHVLMLEHNYDDISLDNVLNIAEYLIKKQTV